jgi:2-dehydro-3-deoxyphosphogluconate aldolase / (4S)-4-hydroxy-2-oxoglutarate aldolase
MKSGVIAVIRTDDPEIALTLARGFNATSVDAIEVTMTVSNALDVIEKLIAEGVTRLGGGTVRTIEQVQRLRSMGAAFGVAPNMDEAILKEAVRLGLPFTPGTLTPSEMVRAQQLGATSLKVFPISAVGGIEFVHSVLEPLPDLALVVSGGVQPSEVRSYIDAGCVGVCMGGALWTQEIASTHDVSAVHSYASKALERIASATP